MDNLLAVAQVFHRVYRLTRLLTYTATAEAFLAAAVWGCQRGGQICMGGKNSG